LSQTVYISELIIVEQNTGVIPIIKNKEDTVTQNNKVFFLINNTDTVRDLSSQVVKDKFMAFWVLTTDI
jgi:hypothetical protein